MRILLIEDDSETRDFLCQRLRLEGYDVDSAEDGLVGLNSAHKNQPDIIIVDRMLPKLDGVALVKALRSDGKQTPIIFLTAMSTVSDRVEGLEAGADDYLVKPFAIEELVARIKALSRRPNDNEKPTNLIIGDLVLDRLTREVSRSGHDVELQSREYQILEFMVTHSGEIVTRKMMLESIWGFQFDPGTNIVESHISRLRSKIDLPGLKPLIKTVRGSGYILDTA